MPVEFKKGRALSALNLTPLIDVVFLLLIFFLVATEFAQDEARSIPVNRPSASEARPITSRFKDIEVKIDANNRVFLDSRLVSPQQLFSALQQAEADNPGKKKVVIDGDRNCRYETVITVIDVCKRLGIDHVAKVDLPPPSAPRPPSGR